jgi:hypothetical protein
MITKYKIFESEHEDIDPYGEEDWEDTQFNEGDKFLCTRTVNNVLGWPLFEEGKTYEILYKDDYGYTLNHNLYANEYVDDWDIGFILLNFRKI